MRCQRLPCGLVDLLGPPAARVGNYDADGFDDLAGPSWVGAALVQFLDTTDPAGRNYEAGVDRARKGCSPSCGCTFKEEGALLGIGAFVGDEQLKANLAIIGKRQRLVPCQEEEVLEERIAQPLFDEAHGNTLHGHGTAQIDLNPPLLDGIARVGLPEGGWITVDDVGRHLDVGASAADPGPHQIVVYEIFLGVLDRSAEHIYFQGAIHIEDARVFVGDHDRTGDAGIGEDVVERAQVPRTHRARVVDSGQVFGFFPMLPVAAPGYDNAVVNDVVPSLGAGRQPCPQQAICECTPFYSYHDGTSL